MRRGSRTVPPSTSGTPHRRQYTPNTASGGSDAQVAPQRQLQSTGDGVALDSGDHRLVEQHARRAKWPVERHVDLDPIPVAGSDLLQIGARAEHALQSVEHGDMQLRIRIERTELLGQCSGSRAIDGVACCGPIDPNGQDVFRGLVDDDGHPPIVMGRQQPDRRWPARLFPQEARSGWARICDDLCRRDRLTEASANRPPKAIEQIANQPQPNMSPASTSVNQCTPSNTRSMPRPPRGLLRSPPRRSWLDTGPLLRVRIRAIAANVAAAAVE